MGIRALARELGLSIGTVSRALNDQPDVKAETRARVKEAARRLGYAPNQSGRSLRRGATGFVAALIPTTGYDENADGGLFRVLEGARRTLLREDLDLIVLFRGPDADPLEHLRRVATRRIADALILTQTVARDPRFAFLEAAGLRYMALGRSLGHEGPHCVDFDFETAAAEAVGIFAAQGRRRLALFLSGDGMNYEALLEAAFRSEAARCGLGDDAVDVVRARERDLPDQLGALVKSPGGGPTAALAAHESVAAALYREFSRRGLRIGADVAVIGASPVIDNRALTPRLSHFDADLDAAGVALGEGVIRQLSGRRSLQPETGPKLIPMRFAPQESHLRTSDALPVTA